MTTATRAADRSNLRTCRGLLVALVAMLGLGSAQGQLVQTAVAGPQKLMITILDGDNALNNIRERDAREPIVQVTDENHKPVAGALLLFTIHGGTDGAGATFAGGATSLSVTTGPDGIAHAVGLLPRGAGKYTITVAASVGAVVAAEVIIHQSNVISAVASSSSSSAGASSSSGAGGAGTGGAGAAGTGGATGAEAGAGGGGSATGYSIKKSKFKKFLNSTAGKVIIGTLTVATVTVVAVAVTNSNSTSITLGTSTVTHP